MTTHKAYSYTRFSSPEQRKGDSRRRQLEAARQYAARKGLELDEELTYHDEGISAFRGRNAHTGRLGEFREAVQVGLIPRGSYLLVESLDRISREAALDAVVVLRDICREGITVVDLNEGGREYTAESLANDTTTILLAVLSFIGANEQSRIKSARRRGAWIVLRERAAEAPMSATCPAWLRLDPATRRFVEIPERAEVVRRIFRELLAGRGRHAIVESLNAEGVPVFGKGRRWHHSYVQKLLDNPAVVGKLIPHTEDYDGNRRVRTPQPAVPNYYPPILDAETFQRAHDLRASRRSSQRGRHAAKEVRSLFAGLAVCSACGGSVTRLSKGASKAGTLWEYLVCQNAKTGVGCTYRLVPYGVVEERFLAEVPAIFGQAPSGDRAGHLEEQLSRAQAALDEVTERIGRLLAGVEEGSDDPLGTPPRSVTRRIHALELAQEELARERDQVASELAGIIGPLVQKRRDDLEKTLTTVPLDRGAANALMRVVFDAVVLDAEEQTLTLRWKTGGETTIVVWFRSAAGT